MRITKALIIADPWIGYILDGSKTWEMRSSSTAHRGWIGLIRKGTGAVYGATRLAEVGAPLTPAEMIATTDRHRIPEEMIRSGAVAKWNTPWKLADVRTLTRPVPYRHKSGAVTWVELDPDVTEAIAQQLSSQEMPAEAGATDPVVPATKNHALERPKRSMGSTAPAVSGRLIGQVELTAGNIRNNHIYLRSFFDRFSADAVGGSNRREAAVRTIKVDWGGPRPAETDLDGQKRFFRARGWVKAFFENNSAEPGDVVLVEEIAPYCYRVALEKKAARWLPKVEAGATGSRKGWWRRV